MPDPIVHDQDSPGPARRALPDVIHFNVTAADISAGIRGSWGHCPIALAVRRAQDIEAACIAVTPDRTKFDGHDYGMASPVRAFIKRFDGGEPVAPFAGDLVHSPTCEECWRRA